MAVGVLRSWTNRCTWLLLMVQIVVLHGTGTRIDANVAARALTTLLRGCGPLRVTGIGFPALGDVTGEDWRDCDPG
jgi:hypothetical protein